MRSRRPEPSPVIYHIIGLNCPDKPEDLMGTNHGVTWFPLQTNCPRCKVAWDQRADVGDTPEMESDGAGGGHIKVPVMKLVPWKGSVKR